MRRLVVCLAVLALAACQDREPTGPSRVPNPQLTHVTLHQEPGFVFISPTPPGNPSIEGEFNPNLTPNVRICRLNGDTGPCVAVVKSGTARVSLSPEQYQFEWSGLNRLRTDFPNDRYYRIEVRSAPIDKPHQFFGSVVVKLTDGVGGGLNVSGNSLPIKFWISTDACPSGSVCTTVYNATGETIEVEPGVAALHFEAQFCASSSPACQDFITVTASRYRGPERCIPNPGFTDASGTTVATIQYELCIHVTTNPANVEFNEQTVFSYLCVDPRADSLAPDHAPVRTLLRVLSVKEVGGSGTGPVTDLTGTAPNPPSGVLDVCDETVFDETTPNGSAAARGRLMRFATLAERALSRVASYLAPDPLHARRRAHIPVVSSPIGFSRLGIALPVVAQFGANGTGSPGGPPNPQPRVCVLAANPDGTFPNTSSPLGVPAVQVEFTATSGAVSPAIDETGSDGCVSANWTLADFVGQQSLVAKVGAPDRLAGVPAVIDGVTNAFPNNEHSTVCDAGTLGCYWWAAHTFTATAATAADPFDVFFLSPLGESTTGQNVTSPEPTVRVCGPLQTNPGACSGLPRPTLRQGAWETSWRTSRTDAVGSRYRIEVLMNNMVTGRFYATSGGGGGGTTDPLGSENNPYQFQRGNTIPVRFKVIAP